MKVYVTGVILNTESGGMSAQALEEMDIDFKGKRKLSTDDLFIYAPKSLYTNKIITKVTLYKKDFNTIRCPDNISIEYDQTFGARYPCYVVATSKETAESLSKDIIKKVKDVFYNDPHSDQKSSLCKKCFADNIVQAEELLKCS